MQPKREHVSYKQMIINYLNEKRGIYPDVTCLDIARVTAVSKRTTSNTMSALARNHEYPIVNTGRGVYKYIDDEEFRKLKNETIELVRPSQETLFNYNPGILFEMHSQIDDHNFVIIGTDGYYYHATRAKMIEREEIRTQKFIVIGDKEIPLES